MTAARPRRIRRWLLVLGVTTALLGAGAERPPSQDRHGGLPTLPTALPASATAREGVLLRLCGCAAAVPATRDTDKEKDQ